MESCLRLFHSANLRSNHIGPALPRNRPELDLVEATTSHQTGIRKYTTAMARTRYGMTWDPVLIWPAAAFRLRLRAPMIHSPNPDCLRVSRMKMMLMTTTMRPSANDTVAE